MLKSMDLMNFTTVAMISNAHLISKNANFFVNFVLYVIDKEAFDV